MKRALWSAILGGVLLEIAFAPAVAATEYVANMGAMKDGNGCKSYSDPPRHSLKEGDTLRIVIENKCEKAWNIRINRSRTDSFAGDCVSFGATRFKFEKKNEFAATNDKRGVSCLVKDSHDKDTYNFEVSESNPDTKLWGLTHGLAVEVDP